MRKGDSNNSILFLKQKFDEIRKNISSIEQRQKEFFVHSKPNDPQELMKSISFRDYSAETNPRHSLRPSSVGRLKDTRTDFNRETETFDPMHIIKTLETEKHELLLQLSKITLLKDQLIKENMQLKSTKSSQLLEIENLREENDRLRRELKSNTFNSSLSFRELRRYDSSLDKFYSTQTFPSPIHHTKPSIIKSDNSSPKKNRVAFSEDLVQVKHISDDDYKAHRPKLRSPSPMSLKTTELSPHRLTSSINFSNSNRFAKDSTREPRYERPSSSLGFKAEEEAGRRMEWKVTRPNISAMSSFEKRVYY